MTWLFIKPRFVPTTSKTTKDYNGRYTYGHKIRRIKNVIPENAIIIQHAM